MGRLWAFLKEEQLQSRKNKYKVLKGAFIKYDYRNKEASVTNVRKKRG